MDSEMERLSGSNLITRVLKSGDPCPAVVMNWNRNRDGRMRTPPAIAGFEGEVGHETRDKGGLWELGKARKQIFPLSLQKETQL